MSFIVMGLGQACRRVQSRRQPAWQGNGRQEAKSQDQECGNIYTWPHSHYLMRRYSVQWSGDKIELSTDDEVKSGI